MDLSGARPRNVAVGLALALVAGVGLGSWLLGRALDGQARQAAERAAIVELGAVGELVERIGPRGEALQPALERLTADSPRVASVRVIAFSGTRLLASTAPEDEGDAAAPRRLAREEKPLFDRGQRLRAAVDSNISEGRAWKEEIEVEATPGGGLSLAAPAEVDGEVMGAILLSTTPAPPAPDVGWLVPSLLVVGPVAALLLLVPLLGGRRVLLLAAAGVLALVSLAAFTAWGEGRLRHLRSAQEETVVARVGQAAERIEGILGVHDVAADEVVGSAWDVDRFRRPRGLLGPEGAADPERLAEEVAALTGAQRRIAVWLGIGSLLLLALVGLGLGERVARTLVDHRRAYGYVVPAMVGMIVLVFIPFFYGIALSFTNSNVYNTDQALGDIWVGLENYVEILTDLEIVKTTEDGRAWNYQNFYWTLGFTVLWTVSNVAIGVSVGLLLALILNTKGLALRPIYRVLLILPWAMPNYITSLIWRGMFHSQFGVINQVIQMMGGSPVSWFDTPFTAFITVLSTNGWLSFPFMMVISLGALQSIPADLYEAARVDGATRWQQFRTITLPSLKPALVPAIILSVVWTFNQFNVIYLVSAGEPGGSTEILITEAYKIAFEQYRYGYAAAYSTVIFLILLVYGIWQNRVTRATEGI